MEESVELTNDELNEIPNEEVSQSEVEKFKDVALASLRRLVIRIFEVVSRYFQFRVRELIDQGIELGYACDTEFSDNEFVLKLKITITPQFVEKMAREYAKYEKIIRRRIRNMDKRERWQYRWREVEEKITAEEKEITEGEENVARGSTSSRRDQDPDTA